MQAADRNPAHTIRAPGSNSEDAAKRVQLSANTTCRLEKLARWRIDPALIKFPKRGFDSEGGNQVMKPSSGCLKPDGRIARLEGDNKSQGAEGSKVERKLGNEEQVEREDQEFDDETCGRRKVSACHALPTSKANS
ncbi:hypothetical protein FS837_008699 [Tulasnella sp. UAMH 9824]|nr:hypothetical protein FS837_008699 [Tulasnella sp. UAMH 9824]